MVKYFSLAEPTIQTGPKLSVAQPKSTEKSFNESIRLEKKNVEVSESQKNQHLDHIGKAPTALDYIVNLSFGSLEDAKVPPHAAFKPEYFKHSTDFMGNRWFLWLYEGSIQPFEGTMHSYSLSIGVNTALKMLRLMTKILDRGKLRETIHETFKTEFDKDYANQIDQQLMKRSLEKGKFKLTKEKYDDANAKAFLTSDSKIVINKMYWNINRYCYMLEMFYMYVKQFACKDIPVEEGDHIALFDLPMSKDDETESEPGKMRKALIQAWRAAKAKNFADNSDEHEQHHVCTDALEVAIIQEYFKIYTEFHNYVLYVTAVFCNALKIPECTPKLMAIYRTSIMELTNTTTLQGGNLQAFYDILTLIFDSSKDDKYSEKVEENIQKTLKTAVESTDHSVKVIVKADILLGRKDLHNKICKMLHNSCRPREFEMFDAHLKKINADVHTVHCISYDKKRTHFDLINRTVIQLDFKKYFFDFCKRNNCVSLVLQYGKSALKALEDFCDLSMEDSLSLSNEEVMRVNYVMGKCRIPFVMVKTAESGKQAGGKAQDRVFNTASEFHDVLTKISCMKDKKIKQELKSQEVIQLYEEISNMKKKVKRQNAAGDDFGGYVIQITDDIIGNAISMFDDSCFWDSVTKDHAPWYPESWNPEICHVAFFTDDHIPQPKIQLKVMEKILKEEVDKYPEVHIGILDDLFQRLFGEVYKKAINAQFSDLLHQGSSVLQVVHDSDFLPDLQPSAPGTKVEFKQNVPRQRKIAQEKVDSAKGNSAKGEVQSNGNGRGRGKDNEVANHEGKNPNDARRGNGRGRGRGK